MSAVAVASRPLEAGIRDQLSTSYGHDFSPVRVHTGPAAEQSARSVGALAYTVGNDVVFSQGAYDPLGASGRSLIAHELAHVAQHGGAAQAPNHLLAPGHSVAPASARLERQADAAAAQHRQGLPRTWSWERSSAPFVGFAPVSWTPPPAPYDVTFDGQTRTIARENRDPSAPGMLRVDIGSLDVPGTKGPWLQRYNDLATAGDLQAVVNVSGGQASAGLWEKRAPSEELRRLWCLRVGWPAAQAAVWWNEAGGSPGGAEFRPEAAGVQSQIDHVVELQLGGSNVPENLAPHDGPANMDSGRQIFRQVSGWANAVKDATAARISPLNMVILHFSSARQLVPYASATNALPALPVEDAPRAVAIAARKGTAASALQVHFTALADAAAGTRPSAADRAAAVAARGPMSPYPIAAGPSPATLQVPAGRTEVPLETSDIAENYAARELIAGVSLEKLTRSGTPHRVTGWIDSPTHPPRTGTRLPIRVPAATDQQLTFTVADTGRLSLQGGAKNVRFTYPYLSAGSLSLRQTETGLEGTGTLTPSVPLLRRAVINVTLANGRFDGSVVADPSKLALPPFRITDASVNVSLAPELAVNGRIGFALGSLLDGELIASVDPDGFVARGTVRAHIRGLDEATGQIEYRPATGLTGFVVVRASSATGLVRDGMVRADFNDAGWSASGSVRLMLPGDSPVDLSVARHGEGLLYTGRGRFNLPGLHPVDLEVSYDGQHVNGTARTTFTVLGVNGDLTVRYRDGVVSGDGHADLQRGRFAGSLDAHLDERGRLSGRGQGSITLRPGLVGTVAVEYTPDHQLHVRGDMRFPPYRFLDRHADTYALFHRTLPPIPIFAIPLPPPLGSVGIVATIGGGLDADYYVGPGEIRDTVVTASFDPLAEDTNLDLTASSRLVIPAHAGLALSARLGIGLSAAVATATGGITLTGGVALDGGFDASVSLHYHGGALVVDARAGIRVQPVLSLTIDADFMIDSPVYTNRWPYQLAAYRYDTGLLFGMAIPVHYATNEEFRLPAARDIEWIVPDIDVGALAERVGDRVRAGIGF